MRIGMAMTICRVMVGMLGENYIGKGCEAQ